MNRIVAEESFQDAQLSGILNLLQSSYCPCAVIRSRLRRSREDRIGRAMLPEGQEGVGKMKRGKFGAF
jgi:hypothetical protein